MVRVEHRESVYAAGQAFVDAALRLDGSLFGSSRDIWSLPVIDNLYHRLLEASANSSDDVATTLAACLNPGFPEAIQLAAELTFVHLLIESDTGYAAKTALIQGILAASPESLGPPVELDLALRAGIAPAGFDQRHRLQALAYLLQFIRGWKVTAQAEQARALNDPWEFKELVPRIDALDVGSSIQREALLHLIFPENFERVVKRDHKLRILHRYETLLDGRSGDIDRDLEHIREILTTTHGRNFDFYQPRMYAEWGPDADPWEHFIAVARARSAPPEVEAKLLQRIVTLTIGLTSAREAIEQRASGCMQALADVLRSANDILDVAGLSTPLEQLPPDVLLRSLGALTGPGEVEKRVSAFARVLARRNQFTTTQLAVLASMFLAVEDPGKYPPYHPDIVLAAMGAVGIVPTTVDRPAQLQLLEYLGFLDAVITIGQERGIPLRNRLDAWVLLCHVTSHPLEQPQRAPGDLDDASMRPTAPFERLVVPTSIHDLADDLLLPSESLETIVQMLRIRGQIIFNGPPGTGKTYCAMALANFLAVHDSRGGRTGEVAVVQLHPAYTSDDFVESRTTNPDGSLLIVDGTLKRIAKHAIENPDATHVLVIDELNRGDLSYVFGEAYHLLEYRDHPVTLAKSQQDLALPHNLLIIGTMNSVSITTPIDPALHRRFFSIPFMPDRPPVSGLLRRWLIRKNPQMAWVADLVENANRLIGDPQRMIGPGFFMIESLSPALCRAIWEHSVLPYVSQVKPSMPLSRLAFDGLPKHVRGEQIVFIEPALHANAHDLQIYGNGVAGT